MWIAKPDVDFQASRQFGVAVRGGRPSPNPDRRSPDGAAPRADELARGVAVGDAPSALRARLRNQRFFSLPGLNTAIRDLLDHLNDRVTRHPGASRREIFDQVERAALKSLPAEPYVFSEWKQCTVGLAPIN